MNPSFQALNIRDSTARQQRAWKDVFDDRFLLKLSQEIGPKEYRMIGINLGFSSPELDRFIADNMISQQMAAFAMLQSYRNGSKKYGTSQHIEEFAVAFETANLMNLACKITGRERVTIPAEPSNMHHSQNLSHAQQETGAYNMFSTPVRPPINPHTGCHPPFQQSTEEIMVKPWTDMVHYREIVSSHDAYRMKSKPRGVAVIINISQVQGMQDRQGSNVDQDLMAKLFDQLHFHVLRYHNLTAEQIKTKLSDLASQRNVDPQWKSVLQNSDCLVVFLMSHGQKDEIFGSDARVVQVKQLFEYFYEDRCEYLKGKPKLFFLQACRGGIVDHGSIQPDSPDSECGFDESDSLAISQPETVNMLVSYSSVEGYKSYRNTKTGSWFVCEIYEVFSELAKSMHILDLLTKVIKAVADKMPQPQTSPRFCPGNPQEKSRNPVYKQCPELRTTLSKQLYFFPGI